MGSVEKMIKWMEDHHRTKGNYPYSMTRRNLDPGLDCSSSVYYALIDGGFLPKGTPIGNTETLFKLNGKIFKEIFSYDEVQRGDIFIRGGEGTSAGAGGHTGIFMRKDKIIHSNYSNNGISINDENSYVGYFLDRKRSWKERYFRPIGNVDNTKKSIKEVAKEVIDGKWGNGQVRFKNLELAGYNYKEVQDEVNRQLREKPVYYVVKAGDSLSAIAKRYGVSLNDLIKRNPQISNPNLIKVGQKIRIK